MIPLDLSKQKVLDANPRAIQQINFTANLDRAGNTRLFTRNSKSIVKVLWNILQDNF